MHGCGRVWVGVGEYKNPLKVTLNHLIARAAAATDLGEFGCRRNVNCPQLHTRITVAKSSIAKCSATL